jgi:hypothetical protein
MHNIKTGLFFACFLALMSARASGQTTCHASDSEGDHFKRIIKAMMTPQNAPLRASLGVPQVDSTQISLISDAVVCARAGQALDSLGTVWAPTSHGPHPSIATLYVFRVGTSYAAIYLDPTSTADGDFIYFFGSSWAYTGASVS